MADDETDDEMPATLDNINSSDEDETDDEDTDDEDVLHGNIGPPVGCDPPPKQWFRLRGKFVAKEFTVTGQEHLSLFCGVVDSYNQTTKKHDVNYEDESTLSYSADEIGEMIATFDLWYAKVSRGGRTMTRKKAAACIVKAHRRKQVQDAAESATVDLTAAPTAAAASATMTAEEVNHEAVKMAVRIKKMRVKEMREECGKLMLNESGLKKALQERLMQHYKCQNILQETVKGKHACKWERKKFDAAPTPFTDAGFNVRSLIVHLPSFPDAVPSPGECHGFFVTDEMWRLGLECTNYYPRTIRSQMQPPP